VRLTGGWQRLPLADGELLWFPRFLDPTVAERLFRRLYHQLNWRQEHIRLFGRRVAQPRLSTWYGDADARYHYSGLALSPMPWTRSLTALRQRLNTLLDAEFNSVLANLYRDGGDGMGWHSDDEAELGPEPVIASLSLGATRRFQLRHRNRDERHELELSSGNLLVMAGSTQRYWQHQIPKTRRPVGPRINLTFRRIIQRPCSNTAIDSTCAVCGNRSITPARLSR
jgi:alkylated DNA repair dioxygenase AlkB